MRYNDAGLIDPDVFKAATDDERAALAIARRVQLAHAKNEHWRTYHAPKRRAAHTTTRRTA